MLSESDFRRAEERVKKMIDDRVRPLERRIAELEARINRAADQQSTINAIRGLRDDLESIRDRVEKIERGD